MAGLAQFRDAILGATSMGVPGAGTSPNMGGANAASVNPMIANLQNLARSGFQANAANSGADALGGQANAQADQERADAEAAAAAAKAKLEEAEEQRKLITDPNKYTKVLNSAGGFDFYDPLGNKIDPKQFAQVKNQNLSDILKDSQDPTDQEFIQDYKDVQELGKVYQSGDKKALDKLLKQDPSLKDRIKGKSYADIVGSFRTTYPQYFSSQNAATTGNPTYKDKVMVKPNQNLLQKLMGLLGG